MGCLGVHLALVEDEVKKLTSFPEDSRRLDYLQEDLEGTYFSDSPHWLAESDKAWDAMHRALANGKLEYTGRDGLSMTVLGGEPLYFQDDYIMSLKTPEQVRMVAAAVSRITKQDFRQRYDAIPASSYGIPKSEEDFEYTWEWFQGVAALYQRAAEVGRYVLFTADQ